MVKGKTGKCKLPWDAGGPAGLHRQRGREKKNPRRQRGQRKKRRDVRHGESKSGTCQAIKRGKNRLPLAARERGDWRDWQNKKLPLAA
ncbi:hypothetical protein ACFX11_038284 [Malus domestica]